MSGPRAIAVDMQGFLPAPRHSLVAFSRPGGSAARARGFTLIELLVVLAIIGLATSAVLFTLPDGHATLYRQADDFALSLKRAREEAVMGGRPVQVGVDATGYRFSRRDFEQWQPLAEKPFAPRAWRDEVHARLPGRQERLGFRFDTTGTAEAQVLQLALGEAQVRVAVDSTGKVSVR